MWPLLKSMTFKDVDSIDYFHSERQKSLIWYKRSLDLLRRIQDQDYNEIKLWVGFSFLRLHLRLSAEVQSCIQQSLRPVTADRSYPERQYWTTASKNPAKEFYQIFSGGERLHPWLAATWRPRRAALGPLTNSVVPSAPPPRAGPAGTAFANAGFPRHSCLTDKRSLGNFFSSLWLHLLGLCVH